MGKGQIQDFFHFLRTVRLRRLLNAGAVLSSYYLSRWTGRPIQWGQPISLSFEPTTSCNLRCPECPSGLRAFTRPTGMLRPDFFEKTIDALSPRLMYLTFYFQGEPYLNPAFLQMVRYASSKGIYTATSTNGHYLSDDLARATVESGLDRLIISLDGATEDVYAQYRVGGQLEKVLEGARRVVEWKRKSGSSRPLVFFQVLAVRPNEHQIEDIRDLAREIGVDGVKVKTAQIYDYENDPNGLIPEQEKYSRYRRNAQGRYEPKNALANHCWRLWHTTVLTWDGRVVPCCFDKDAQHSMGSLEETSFLEVWKGQAYRNFRTRLLGGRKNIDICANCSEGTRVWAE